jgi:hypothetical protein
MRHSVLTPALPSSSILIAGFNTGLGLEMREFHTVSRW